MDTTPLTPGRATAPGTRRFADRFRELPEHFRAPDGLSLASLGMGTRPGEVGGADDLLYRSAVLRALERGVNVFDTALSYRMQQSERSLGTALGRAFRAGSVARDEIYVISKGGYLCPDPRWARGPAEAQRYLIETYLESGLVDPDAIVAGRHSLDPSFIEDQIRRSRANLGLETIDLYCLQDPELHLVAKGPDEFWSLLRRVFETLEAAVQRGEIGAYGLSTADALVVPHTEKGHLSIGEILELALDVGGADHHLRGIQLPYGVAMGDAWGVASQFAPGGHASVFEALRDTGTPVFATVPLLRGRAARGLPAFLREAFPGLVSDAQCALQFVRSTPGVTTAIVGMRELEHVDENLALARHEPAAASVIRKLFGQVP